MHTKIPNQSIDASFYLLFPILKMFEFAIGSGGLLLPGLMRQLALLFVELGAQWFYDLEDKNSSIHEAFAYDMKPYYEGKKYIANKVIEIYTKVCNKKERKSSSYFLYTD